MTRMSLNRDRMFLCQRKMLAWRTEVEGATGETLMHRDRIQGLHILLEHHHPHFKGKMFPFARG